MLKPTRVRSIVALGTLVGLLCITPTDGAAQSHDLSLLKLKVGPRKAKLRDSAIIKRGRIVVVVRNGGGETLTVPDLAALATGVHIDATPNLGVTTCSPPTISPDPSRRTTPPFSVAPGKKAKLRFAVDFTCGPNPILGIDWSFAAQLDHTALDGAADENPADDVCPRQPLGDDRGCGQKISGGARIAPTVDVVDKRSLVAFALPGPWPAGRTSITLVDSSRPTMANGPYPGAPERTLSTMVWYPGTFGGVDAPIAPSGAPYPLLIFAHGLGSPNNGSAALCAHLASHGYIVAAPAFPLSTLGAPGGPSVADQPDQALDVSFVIDSMIALSDQSGHLFESAVDTDSIGMFGHSNGGMTTLITTFDEVLRDPRIDAAMPMSPPGCIFQPGWYGSVDVPLLVLFGDSDLLVNFDENALSIFDRANAPKSLVRLFDGSHIGFSDLAVGFGIGDAEACAGLPDPVTLETQFTALIAALGGAPAFVSDTGCSIGDCTGDAPTMDGDRQVDISLQVGAAFFAAHLRGDATAWTFLYEQFEALNSDLSHTFE